MVKRLLDQIFCSILLADILDLKHNALLSIKINADISIRYFFLLYNFLFLKIL